MSFTVADIGVAVKRQFGDQAGVQVTDTYIIDWINDAQRLFAGENKILQTRAQTSLITGQQSYTMPTDYLRIHAVKFNNFVLREYSQAEADQLIDQDDSQSYALGQPTLYWIWANEFNLYPIPDGTTNPSNLVVYYVREPTPVQFTSDTIAFPDEYKMAFIDYCLKQAYELDENLQMATYKDKQLDEGLGRLREQFQDRHDDEYAIIGYRDDGDMFWPSLYPGGY
jgi:hypothetical protein